MLQVNYISEHKETVIKGLKKKRYPDAESLVNQVLDKDKERKELQTRRDQTLADANKVSKEIGQLMKEGRKEEADQAKSRSTELKSESKDLEQKLQEVEEALNDLLYYMPNPAHQDVPEGDDDTANELIEESGESPVLHDGAKPHWELIKNTDIIDFELGTKITGAGFPVYKGKGARLQRGLVQYFLDHALKNGYEEIQPPVVVNEASGYGTGQLPDKDGQMYRLADENFYLIPTAEVPITNIYRDVILQEKDLPVKNAGYTPCFRREAGSWGSHVRGLNRLHQFDKVEIVQVAHPDHSYEALDGMMNYIKTLLAELNLPYRVLRLCGGDLGFAAAMTYDFEVYSAAQDKWLEVSSVSNFENFQANRLKLRYKDSNGKNRLLHTLNGSALALPRIMAAILENNQTADGEIVMPEKIIPYTGFEKI